MTILSVSQEKKSAVVHLSSEELGQICNALHAVPDERRNKTFYIMYANMQNARDLSVYGHLDEFSLEYALKTKLKADGGKVNECQG